MLQNSRVSFLLILIIILDSLFCFLPTVQATPTVDDSYTLLGGYSTAFGMNMNASDILNVEYNVVSGGDLDIDVYIMNSEAYDNFAVGKDFSAYVTYLGESSLTFNFTAPEKQVYSVVFSNSESQITSKVVEIKITYYPHLASNNSDIWWIALLIVALIGGIAFVVVKFVIHPYNLRED
jgi:hypothetical protein